MRMRPPPRRCKATALRPTPCALPSGSAVGPAPIPHARGGRRAYCATTCSGRLASATRLLCVSTMVTFST